MRRELFNNLLEVLSIANEIENTLFRPGDY